MSYHVETATQHKASVKISNVQAELFSENSPRWCDNWFYHGYNALWIEERIPLLILWHISCVLLHNSVTYLLKPAFFFVTSNCDTYNLVVTSYTMYFWDVLKKNKTQRLIMRVKQKYWLNIKCSACHETILPTCISGMLMLIFEDRFVYS